MSFYIIKHANLLNRETNLLVLSSFNCGLDKPLDKRIPLSIVDSYDYLDNDKKYFLSLPFDKDIKESLDLLFQFVSLYNLSNLEIYLSKDINDKSFDKYLNEILDNISSYLINNELDIGLIFSDDNDILRNIDIINKYNVLILESSIKGYDSEYNLLTTFNNEVEHKRSFSKNIRCSCAPTINDDLLPGSAPIDSCYRLEPCFNKVLLKYLIKSNRTNSDIYNSSGITRQVFSKIISDKYYEPKKSTIISLIIGLKLNSKDALKLLNSAGYTLSPSILFDVIIAKCIEDKMYDLMKVNTLLNDHNLPLLGWKPRD